MGEEDGMLVEGFVEAERRCGCAGLEYEPAGRALSGYRKMKGPALRHLTAGPWP